ncbi:MAG: endolytic transglycosylase MltG [Solirubrobacterales bacterium]
MAATPPTDAPEAPSEPDLAPETESEPEPDPETLEAELHHWPSQAHPPPPLDPEEHDDPPTGDHPTRDGWAAHQQAAWRARRSAASGRRGAGRIAAAVGAVLVGAAVLWLALALWQPFGDQGDGIVQVRVPEGSGTSDIAQQLDEEKVVGSARLFELRLTLSGKRGEIQAGAYTLAEGMSYGAAIDELTTPPERRVITVSIPEGLSRRELAPIVREAGVKGDYRKASQSSKGFAPDDYGAKDPKTLEGFLFPSTYELRPGASANQLVRKQTDAFVKQFDGVSRSKIKQLTLTPYEILTVASMIEREVSLDKERPLVAAVIYNRLRKGEPLGIDATVRFAVNNWTEPLTKSELDSSSAYNTRKRAGLPPGPIGNPGLASIEAAVEPADSDAFFYVVKPNTCNEHTFVETSEEFEQASAAYNRAREEAGGRAPTSCPDDG